MVLRSNATQQQLGSQVDESSELSRLMDPRLPEGYYAAESGRSWSVMPQQPLASRPVRRSLLRSIIVLGGKVGVLLFLAWGMIFHVSEVRGSSMMPGIHDRDRILVDNLTYMLASVERGDVVVMRYPLDPSLDYLKRVVGLPGDEVVIARGRVSINGDRWPEPYVAPESVDPYTSLRTVVQDGHCFVLGDNRLHSSDSREFGQVPFEYVRGKVRARIWPLSRLGSIR